MSTNSILASAPLTTQNYHLKMIGTSIGNSLIWDNGTNVGIGNTNTSYTLDVTGSGRYLSGNEALRLDTTSTAFDTSIRFYNNNSATYWGGIQAGPGAISGGGMNIYNNGAYPMAFNVNGSERMRITSAGNVGIGTSSPDSKLQVEGGELKVTTNNAGVAAYYTAGTGEVAAYNWTGAAWIPLSYAGQYHIWKNSGTEVMRITSGGNVVIQNNKIYGTGEYLGAIWNSNGGNTTWTIGDTPANQTSWNLRVNTSAAKSGGGSWGDSSDGRLKKDVQTIQNALDKINKLNPVTFEWINPEEHNNQYNIGGFIAQEIKEIFPQFVNEINAEGKDKDIVGENEVVYGLTLPFKFDAYIVKAIQELSAQVQEQNQTIQNLQEQINILAK